MAKKPSPQASVIERDVRVEIRDGIFLSIKDAAGVLNVSSKYLADQLRNPASHFNQLAPFFKDLNGGRGKPMWRIALRDLSAFQTNLPTMAAS